MSLLRRLNSPPLAVCIAVIGLLVVTGWQNRQAASARAERSIPIADSIAAEPEVKVPPVNPQPDRAEGAPSKTFRLRAKWYDGRSRAI